MAGVNSTETDEELRAAYSAVRKRLPVGGQGDGLTSSPRKTSYVWKPDEQETKALY